jgi:Cyclic nucleotide-binding domain
MALEWLKASLTKGNNYGKVIDQLQAKLKKKRNDPRLQLQLAEVYVQAKRLKEALPLLEAVADDFALQGFAARAIAILKRIKALDPTHTQAEEKLAYLISQEDNPAPSPWRAKAEAHRSSLDIGMEEIDDSAMGMEAASDDAGPGPMLPDRAPAPDVADFNDEPETAVPPPLAGPLAGIDLNDDDVRHEFIELIDMAFAPDAPTAAGGAVAGGVSVSPLFSDLKPDELIAVIRGLRLATFEPGEIIVSQGEPGQSLFVVASGQARAYLKDKGGRSVQVRELSDGDFFGEIALMLGSPRTATITARTRCELLELGRSELDAVARSHPRVREVLQEFYVKRVNTSVDSLGKQ